MIELLIVMAVIAMLLTIVTPRYFKHVDEAKEATLRQNLAVMRDTIDKYHGDTGKYPDSLQDLVEKQYIRRVPDDPMTESNATWITVAPQDSRQGGIYDVRSGSNLISRNGSAYSEW